MQARDFRHPEIDALSFGHIRLLRHSQVRERRRRFARADVERTQRRLQPRDLLFCLEEKEGGSANRDQCRRAEYHSGCS